MYIWTVWVVVAFIQVAFATSSLPNVPSNLAILMGINGLAAACSTAISDPQKLTLRKVDAPDFFSDLFLDKNGTLDLPRTQMFIWTLVTLTIHMVVFFKGYQNGGYPTSVPNIEDGLLMLMGVSNGAYVAVKAATETK